jgi:hypothetical protein
LKRYGIDSEIQFSEFLDTCIGKGMLRRQTYWLKNFRGHVDLDFIGRFENLQNDFETVKNALNVPELELPHLVNGGYDTYREAYDSHSIDVIANFYRDEIKLFGYKFE